MAESNGKISWDRIRWYFINLLSRGDRRKHIKKQLVKAGIKATRFDAFRKEDYFGQKEDVALMQATPNTIGNWMSHTACISKGIGYSDIVGVLEDDALICSDFRERIDYIENHFHEPWDIFFLGGTFHADRAVWHPELGADYRLTNDQKIVRMFGAFSNQGYLINSSSADKILAGMRRVMSQSRGSDHALIQIQPELECYAFIPGCVFQIDGKSDISSGGYTQFSNFLTGLGPHAWADRMEDFDYEEWERMQ